jgi:hypothetical protein
MNKDIEQRIRYVKAKIRNIGYYWEYDESLGEVRSRKQYMHVLKPSLSNEVIELIIKDNPAFLKAFLFTDYEIEKVKERYL